MESSKSPSIESVMQSAGNSLPEPGTAANRGWKRCCWTPLRAGSGSVCQSAAAQERLVLDPIASEGPAKRSKPDMFGSRECRCRVGTDAVPLGSAEVAEHAAIALPATLQASAAHGSPPWPRAAARKEESEEGTIAWCPPRLWAGARTAVPTLDARGPLTDCLPTGVRSFDREAIKARGCRPCTPARERPLKCCGLSLALFPGSRRARRLAVRIPVLTAHLRCASLRVVLRGACFALDARRRRR